MFLSAPPGTCLQAVSLHSPCGQLSVTSAVEPTSAHFVLPCQRYTWCTGAGAERSPGPPPALPARTGRGHCPARFPGPPPAPAPLKCCFSPPRPSLGGGGGGAGRLKGRDLIQLPGRGEGKGGTEAVYAESYSRTPLVAQWLRIPESGQDGYSGSIPGQGRSHVQSKDAHEPQILKPAHLEPVLRKREATHHKKREPASSDEGPGQPKIGTVVYKSLTLSLHP